MLLPFLGPLLSVVYIDLHRQLYPDRARYQMIASSLLEKDWLDEIPGVLPAMIAAEGVMMYLPVDEGGPLFR